MIIVAGRHFELVGCELFKVLQEIGITWIVFIIRNSKILRKKGDMIPFTKEKYLIFNLSFSPFCWYFTCSTKDTNNERVCASKEILADNKKVTIINS